MKSLRITTVITIRGTRGVRRATKSTGFIFWGSWMSEPHFTAKGWWDILVWNKAVDRRAAELLAWLKNSRDCSLDEPRFPFVERRPFRGSRSPPWTTFSEKFLNIQYLHMKMTVWLTLSKILFMENKLWLWFGYWKTIRYFRTSYLNTWQSNQEGKQADCN